MTKEHAYAYEAGYRDGSINYELEHCPACKNVADLQDALAENARLRELVLDMWNDMCVCHDQHVHPSSRDLRFHADRMSELGVGVDE